MKFKIIIISLSAVLALAGCGSSSSSGGESSSSSSGGESPIGNASSGGDTSNSPQENSFTATSDGNAGTADLIVSTLIDQTTGFINAVEGSSTEVDNENGAEIDPSKGIFTYNGYVYTSGSLTDNKIAVYSIRADNSLKLEKELVTKESGMAIPTTFTFVNNTKAYIPLAGVGELLDINLEDFSIRQRIDLSEYAMNEGGTFDGNDTNPEPAAGVIRGDKFYLGLGQVNGLGHTQGSFLCRGLASVLIIDIATNAINKHITDDRTCTSGSISPGSSLTLDDNGDIYVNNTASFGYHPDQTIRPGYLRIKAGESVFDPDYFFNVGDLDLSSDFPDMNASLARGSYVYKEKYHNGSLYMTMFILGLTTRDPNDFIGNKNYQPYKLDLPNKTATKLDMLPTNGWSAQMGLYNDNVIYAEATENANGLYKINEKIPFMTTIGQPLHVLELKK